MQTVLIDEACRSIADLMSDYVSVSRMEPDGGSVLEWVTPWFYEWTGYRPEELPERDPWAALIHPDDMEVIRRHRATILGGHDDTCELRIRTRDGRTRWLRSTARPKWDDREGRVTLVFGAGRDITREKESLERLRIVSFAVEQTAEGIVVVDSEGNLLMVNPAFAAMHGYKPDELVGRHLSIFHTAEQMPAVEEANELIRRTGDFRGEIWHARRDGTVFPSLMHNSILRDETGRFVGLIGTLIDLTEIRRQEQAFREREERLRQAHDELEERVRERTAELEAANMALRESEERFRSLVAALPIPIAITRESDGVFLYVNAHAAGTWGVPPSDLIGRRAIDFYADPADYARMREGVQAKGGLYEYERHVRRADGSTSWFLISSQRMVYEGQAAMISGFYDISERKRAEETLSHQTALLRSILGSIPGGVFWKNGDSTYEGCNDVFAAAAGLASSEGIVGKTDYDMAWTTEQGDWYRACDRDVMDGDTPMLHIEETQRQADGKQVVLVTNKVPRHGPDGQVCGMLGIFTDITERKQMEESLRQSEAHYRALFERSPISLWEEDLSAVGRWLDSLRAGGVEDLRDHINANPQQLREAVQGVRVLGVNQATCLLFGVQDVAQLDGNLSAVFCEGSDADFADALCQLWEGRGEFELQVRMVTLGGRPVDCILRLYAPSVGGRLDLSRVIVALVDITARRRAEELARQRGAEVAHMSRLSIMGEMATELAHEVNQPLAAIGNYARGCLRRLESGEYAAWTVLDAVRQIVAEADRADEVIRRIRDFARRHEAARSTADLNAIVRQAVQFVEYEAKSREVRVALEPSASIAPMEIDGIQIQQVLLNLFRNAIDAMANTEGRPRCLRVTTAMDGKDSVRVSVSDTGEGVTPEQAKRLFEPFYTTKPEGTGLGLPISQSIIQAHGGRLWAELNDGPGVTFHFTLPATATVR